MRRAISILVTLLLLSTPVAAQAEAFYVIVNTANKTKELSQDKIKALYLGKDPFVGGVRVRLVDRSGEVPERVTFLTRVVGMSVKEFDRYWMSKSYRDSIPPPKQVGSPQEVMKWVASTAGAVGFILAKDYTNDGSTRVVAKFE